MTYAVVMIRGSSEKREDTLKFLNKLKTEKDFKKKTGASIKEVLISFGWPDFVLLMYANNVELLKEAIVNLRNILYKKVRDAIETSTIICSTLEDIEEAKNEWKKSLG
jgi:hypothetical protein